MAGAAPLAAGEALVLTARGGAGAAVVAWGAAVGASGVDAVWFCTAHAVNSSAVVVELATATVRVRSKERTQTSSGGHGQGQGFGDNCN